MLEDFPLAHVYQLIEPGPVVLLTTAQDGHADVMTMSWHMMVEFEPPLIACVVSAANHSFAALAATRECVIAIPTVEQAEQVVAVGNCSGRATDKFTTIGLTPHNATLIKPPLLPACAFNLECRVIDDTLVERYNLFVLEVIKAWRNPALPHPRTIHHQGYGHFVVDGEAVSLPSKMP